MALVKIILLESVKGLGTAGSYAFVKPGFFRNYLYKNHKALRANSENVKALEERKEHLHRRDLEKEQEAQVLYQRLEALRVKLPREVGEGDRLYGSVGAMDIVKALAEEGFLLDKNMVLLKSPLKVLGDYEIDLLLHPRVSCRISVSVVRA